MAVKQSTGSRNQMLDTAPFRTIYNLGFVKLYAGTPPASADDALGGATLLCTLSNNSTGTGLTFEANAVNGVIAKTATETWSGVNAATGTASFYRLVTPADTGGASTTEPRVQGNIGTAGSDMNLTSTSLTSGATQTLPTFNVSLPTN